MLVRGPLTSGDSCVVVCLDSSNTPYVLNGATDPVLGTFLYYWESNPALYLTSTVLPVFNLRLAGTPGLTTMVTLTDQVNQGYLAAGGPGFTANNAPTATVFTLRQTTSPAYTPWPAPTVALAGVSYGLTTASGATVNVLAAPALNLYPLGLGPVPVPGRPATAVQFLPVVWYAGCNGGASEQVQTAAGSLANWLCNLDPSATVCASLDLVADQGYTQLRDCVNNFAFPYCTNPTLCNTNGCQGPCSQIYYDCLALPDNSAYACKFNAAAYTEDPAVWRSPLFVGVVLGILLGILLLLLVLARVLGLWGARKKTVRVASHTDVPIDGTPD